MVAGEQRMTPQIDLPVLVVVVNNRRDWQYVCRDHWYRIPLRHAPPAVAASFLAFYQTRCFGDEAWSVQWYARVRQYREVARRDLLPAEAEHPRADERYYRIDLDPPEPLPKPIPSRRLRRITFIPTSYRRLLTASEINDLWMHDVAEEVAWAWFRDAALKATYRLTLSADEPA